MLDPFHAKYGKAITTVMSVASLFLDVIWVPTTLTGLGTINLLLARGCTGAVSRYNRHHDLVLIVDDRQDWDGLCVQVPS